MRVIWTAAGLALALAGCAKSYSMDTPLGRQAEPEWPFPVARGSALAPPTADAPGQSAPPEGVGPGGVDFGAWKSADPALYQPQFEAQMRARLAGLSRAAAEADLARNGFACETDGARMDCRIEIMERQCAFDWYVVRAQDGAPPAAGFEIMCLGSQ